MTEYDPNVIAGIRVSGPPATSTPEQKEKYQKLVEAARKAATGRWTVAPGCFAETECGKRREGDLIGKGEIPTSVLRALIAREVILELDPDEVQRRADLKTASHIYARDKVTGGVHRRKGDPAFPEHFGIKARAAYSYVTKAGEVRQVTARPAQDGTERFEAAVDSGRVIPNPADKPSKRRRAS